MREIKFRAWDGKGMRYWGFMEKDKCGYAFYGPPSNPYGNPMTMTHMQYTGLKDKNGKEIYEGDIVEDGVGNIDRIAFHPAGFFAIQRNGDDHAFIETDRVKVIGNIYENGDLLK